MIPLVVRSHYSLMWGTASPRQICRAARRMGYDRLALTDTDNLYGLWPFLAACRREGVTPIVGAEITDPGSRRRAVCLVETDAGYRNLCRLLSRRHLQAETFNLEKDLPARAAGLTVLTAHPDLLEAWHAGGVTVAAAMPRRVLLATHPLRTAARRLGVAAVAVPGSFFLCPQDAAGHRILRAIARNTCLSRLEARDQAPVDAWLAPPAEYERRFTASPEALSATAAIAERLVFTGPRFGTVLPPLAGHDAESAVRNLRAEAYAGARRRYGAELGEAVVERLEHELGLIAQMGFAAYFLIVRDIVALSPRTCGRGSGAASLVAYCLGITNVCPLKHNLYFERFLNPGRTDPPDIDVDFAWDERDAVLETVLARHRGHAAMVANHVLFQPRMAVREVAKVYGLPAAEIDRVSRRLPWYWRAEEAHADFLGELKRQPETKTLEFPPPWPEILRYAQRIIGTPRHLSVHPGGVVITPRPIDEYVPIERAPKGVPIIQWEKDAAEDAGLVKIDLLGNRSLGVIRDAQANLRKNGIGIDESRWEPEDDFVTQQAVAQGRTMGCFYIESPAMRLLQQKSRVGDFEHLVVHSSIIRPAANDYIREYIRRLHGGSWAPIHPLLADVLEETFGIMVYQEDVSRAAVAVAGFTHVEADGLRKILSKKDRELQLRDQARRFREGARAKGVSDESITAIWDMMMSFDGYSFCKPHSASYARVSFQAAYLKVHHPAEFMAAVISNQGGFYSVFAYVSEARRLGLAILPPDVNASDRRWTGQQAALRVGLLAVKGLSAETQERIAACRRDRVYSNLGDFMERVRPDAAELRALVHCGALDRLGPGAGRAELLWDATRRLAKLGGTGRAARNRSLFAAPPAGECPPRLPPDDARERLRREFAVLGFLCGRHPMELYADAVRRAGAVKAADLPRCVGRRIRFAGWLITGKVVETKQGEPMEFLTFEDETGLVETTFFPETYRRFCHLLDRERPYLLSGKVEEDWGAVTLTVEQAAGMRP
ncbi:MAG: DNA polymerase III subunit alpha [Desulfobacterales bacterium]|nr:DNA polymerase III subunit alpha [Desulfobacterales bacterium]